MSATLTAIAGASIAFTIVAGVGLVQAAEDDLRDRCRGRALKKLGAASACYLLALAALFVIAPVQP